MTKRALLFVNTNARRGRNSLSQAIELLSEADFDVLTISARRFHELPDIIRQHAQELDLVILGGGDGTLNQVVDCLVETQLPLGILPLGTANDLARTLKIPLSLPEACRVIAAGHQRRIDLGWVNGKHFFNVASMGLGVEITRKLSKTMKRRWGVLAYLISAMQVALHTRPFNAEICCEGNCSTVRTVQIAVGNGRYYGGGMAIATDATIDDHRLDVYSLEIQNWWQIFPFLLRLRKGEQANLPWVRAFETQMINISTRKPQDVNTDGEITTATPATFKVVPAALSVFVPDVNFALPSSV